MIKKKINKTNQKVSVEILLNCPYQEIIFTVKIYTYYKKLGAFINQDNIPIVVLSKYELRHNITTLQKRRNFYI